jgi:hypothetical protein
MRVFNFHEFKNKQEESKITRNFIHKGARILPDLETTILASLRGYLNGSYPKALTGDAEQLGYYPLSDATADERSKIEAISKKIK